MQIKVDEKGNLPSFVVRRKSISYKVWDYRNERLRSAVEFQYF